MKRIIAGTTGDRIIAVTAIDVINSAETKYYVGAGTTKNQIGVRAADDVVVTIATVDDGISWIDRYSGQIRTVIASSEVDDLLESRNRES